MRDDDEPYFEDEVDKEPPPSKKSKNRVPPIAWMAIGAGGLLIMGAFLLLAERSDRRRAQAMMREFEAVRQAKQKASMPMAIRLSREDLEQRLIDSRLESIHDDGVWAFTSEDFVLEAGERPLPSDLLDELLGRRRSASRIKGKWKLTEDRGLRLTDIRGDGKAGVEEAYLWIEAHVSMEEPGGRVRVNIGRHEYKLINDKGEK